MSVPDSSRPAFRGDDHRSSSGLTAVLECAQGNYLSIPESSGITCWRWRSRPFLHLIPKRDDCLQGFDHGFPIIFLFGFGELLVRHQIGVFFLTVVTLDA